MTAEDNDPIQLVHDLKLYFSTREGVPRIWGGFSGANNLSAVPPHFDLVVYGPKGTTAQYKDVGYIAGTVPTKVTAAKGYQHLFLMLESHMKNGNFSKPIFIDKGMAKTMIEGLLAGIDYVHQDPLKNITVGVEVMVQALPDFMQKSFVRRSLFESLPKAYPDLQSKLRTLVKGIPHAQVENGLDMKNKFLTGGKLIELPEFVVPVGNAAPTVHLDW